jgi:hypothetical protein
MLSAGNSFLAHHYTAANSTLSISVASSASAFELLTRVDTDQPLQEVVWGSL